MIVRAAVLYAVILVFGGQTAHADEAVRGANGKASRLDGYDFGHETRTSQLLGLDRFVGQRADFLDGRPLTLADILTIGRVVGLAETRLMLSTGAADPAVTRAFGGLSGLRSAILSALPSPSSSRKDR